MKNLIKIILIMLVFTLMFIKVYAPLMSQETNFQKAQRAIPVSKDIALTN
ncbi:MAG: hypothetical protein M3R36_07010 [Bacteroidota bacterium]|nr:hypothetical protein [Bacteroidota bacterium]